MDEYTKHSKQSGLQKPTPAFIGASWAALFIGSIGFSIGLWNAELNFHEKGYYFTLLAFGIFSVISLQKTIRDRNDNIPTTNIYFGICWLAVGLCLLLTTIGLWNATLLLSEKGFYAMSFLLALFGAITVQKNTRDLAAI